jgi:hypothetical protein
LEPLNDFIANLSNENIKKIPIGVYGIKESISLEVKLVTNAINRTNQYYCLPYYKPITQIIDLEVFKLEKNGED